MSAAELLAELRGRGIQLEAVDRRLRYAAPKGTLTADLRAAVADAKDELLRLLTLPATARACPDCGSAVEAHELRCGPCLARWRATPVPWCAAIDCRRPQSGKDQGFCSPEHRAQTEEAWSW